MLLNFEEKLSNYNTLNQPPQQFTGERFEEPLETMTEFRAMGKNKEDVFFGQNVVLQPTSGFYCTLSSISVGDEVKILTRGTPEWGH